MKQQKLEFLLHSDLDPQNINCRYYKYSPGDITDNSILGRKKNIIHLILNGKREYLFDGKRRVFDENSVIFIPNGTQYTTLAASSKGELCEGVSVLFTLDESIEESIPQDVYQITTFSKSNIKRTFSELCDLCSTMPTQTLKKKMLTLELIYAFLSALIIPDENSCLITPALEYIASHYRENLPISSYAAVCNLSESYFRKKFLEITGLSPIAYRNQLRFYEARQLYQSGYTMKAIAEEIGFCDENYLSKLYIRNFGKSLKEDSEW